MSHPQQGQQPYQQAQGGGAPVPAPQHAPAPVAAGLNMKRRNPVGVWLGLPLITLGIYNLVWYFKVHNELFNFDRRTGDAATGALLSLIFGFITLGIWPLITYLKLAGRIAQAQRAAGLQPTCSGGMAFLLGIFSFGMLYYQIELNKIVDRYGDTPAGQQVSLAA
ncbi:DUF4234 domain-containing protein [Actinomadura atramentaria]|uniref:DUF4234 domain-containing protein n=1 Tax=Actinomadura atramentaria TaxID=1990 RepID=UPI0003651DBF|nr:DUF4234 domain-containing protein [Actinomadura atramentaria]